MKKRIKRWLGIDLLEDRIDGLEENRCTVKKRLYALQELVNSKLSDIEALPQKNKEELGALVEKILRHSKKTERGT